MDDPAVGAVLAAGCAAQAGTPATPAADSATPATPTAASAAGPATDCAPVDGAEFLCGVVNVEQLVRIEETRWAVGSSTAGVAAPIIASAGTFVFSIFLVALCLISLISIIKLRESADEDLADVTAGEP